MTIMINFEAVILLYGQSIKRDRYNNTDQAIDSKANIPWLCLRSSQRIVEVPRRHLALVVAPNTPVFRRQHSKKISQHYSELGRRPNAYQQHRHGEEAYLSASAVSFPLASRICSVFFLFDAGSFTMSAPPRPAKRVRQRLACEPCRYVGSFESAFNQQVSKYRRAICSITSMQRLSLKTHTT